MSGKTREKEDALDALQMLDCIFFSCLTAVTALRSKQSLRKINCYKCSLEVVSVHYKLAHLLSLNKLVQICLSICIIPTVYQRSLSSSGRENISVLLQDCFLSLPKPFSVSICKIICLFGTCLFLIRHLFLILFPAFVVFCWFFLLKFSIFKIV